MAATTTTEFRIHPIPAPVLEQVRTGRRDVSGNAVEHIVAVGGEPLRCCLRDAQPGAELMLFGYEPPIPAGPYREVGPVFTHAQPCSGPTDTEVYPPGWYGRPQVMRAYDERGWIHNASRVHDGHQPEAVIAEILAQPDVVEIHSRNVVYGCYMFAITRAS